MKLEMEIRKLSGRWRNETLGGDDIDGEMSEWC